ncbi:MAG: T9SS type A sorting domain-containing protein [Bacteroidetes bacterium]|nr:T9SS type A sorting domain-containing protein [Bacteroidota bacterium]
MQNLIRLIFPFIPGISLLFSLFSSLACLHAQATFFNTIHPPGDNNADVIETDSSYVVLQQGNPPFDALHLHHFDKTGAYSKTDSFDLGTFYESAFNGICDFKDGYLKLSTMYVNQDTFWIHLTRFDSALDTLHTLKTSYLNQLSTEAISVHYFAPNTIIISGMYMVRAGLRADGYLLALDTSLQVKWEQTYIPTNLNSRGGFVFYDVASVSDGGFIIGGERLTLGASGPWRRKGVLLKVDSLGQEIWREELDGPVGNHRVLVEEINDSSAAFFTTRIDVPDSQPFTQLRFGVADNKGILLDTTMGGVVRNMTPDFFEWSPNIGFVGGGFAQGLGFKSYAANIDPTGSINWKREYFNGNDVGTDYGYLESMTFTQDGGMLFAGYFLDRNGSGANMWLVKTDSLGCDTPGCQNIGLEERIALEQSRIQLYPNPAKDAVSLSFGSSIVQNHKDVTIQLFNLQGKLIRSQVLQLDLLELSLELSDVPKGVYSVEVLSDGKKIGYSKLLVN